MWLQLLFLTSPDGQMHQPEKLQTFRNKLMHRNGAKIRGPELQEGLLCNVLNPSLNKLGMMSASTTSRQMRGTDSERAK